MRPSRIVSLLLLGLCAAGQLPAQTLKLFYDFHETGGTYANGGDLDAPLTPRGSYQVAGADGSGVSGSTDDRCWDTSANTTQGATSPYNNAALTTPATGLDLSTLGGFTISFWFRTEQSLDSDAAVRFVYKANAASGTVTQGLTLRSLDGALELRIAGADGMTIAKSTDFGTSSGYNRVGSWIFVALTWDGSTIQYYCGGPDYNLVLAGSTAFTGPIVNYTGSLVVGNTSSYNRGLDGAIDNFRFYDGPLTKAALEALRLSDAGLAGQVEVGGPLRPLAPDFTVVGEAADPATEILDTPQIVRLDSGRLVASYERRSAAGKEEAGTTLVATSDDGGVDWTQRASFSFGSAHLFAAGGSVYLIGHYGDLLAARSADSGETWSAPSVLATGPIWNRSAGNVWISDGTVSLALLRRVTRARDGWNASDLAPVLLQAAVSADLTLASSWTFSDSLALGDLFAKYDATGDAGRYFGVPFREPSSPRDGPVSERNALSPVGWLDANVVQIGDPDHDWYDATGRTWHLLLRAHTGGAGFAALMKVVREDDGSLHATAETVPSGKKMLFLPLPGGEDRFSVVHDTQTSLFWMVTSQPTDSMRRRDLGGSLVAGRDRLALYFSRNLVDWCFAGPVASADAGGVLHDAVVGIDNLDLVILSRSGDSATPAGEGDFITFRRIHDFRNLVY